MIELNRIYNEDCLEGMNRIPDRVDRLKSLGNAIVPQVAYEILKTILLAGER